MHLFGHPSSIFHKILIHTGNNVCVRFSIIFFIHCIVWKILRHEMYTFYDYIIKYCMSEISSDIQINPIFASTIIIIENVCHFNWMFCAHKIINPTIKNPFHDCAIGKRAENLLPSYIAFVHHMVTTPILYLIFHLV